MKRYMLALVALLALSQCRTGDPRGTAAGQDYLEREFRCVETLPQKQDPALQFIRTKIREAWANENRGAADIVFAGDSTMALFAGPRLATLSDFDIANRAIGGETTQGLLDRAQSDIINLRPRVVVIDI